MNHFGITVLVAIAILFLGSCSDKNDSTPTPTPAPTSKKLVFKAEASAGSTVNMVVYGYDGTLTTATSINSQSWTSPEITVPGDATVATITTNGRGVDASSSLKVQVYIDDVMKKEGTGTGTALSAAAQYNLK